MNKFSHLLYNLPDLTSEIVNEALTNEYRQIERPYGLISESLTMSQTKFAKNLENKFGSARVGFLKMRPGYYDWHRDDFRNCAINWLVTPSPKALTLHRTNQDKIFWWDIEEVKYIPLKPTLLDVTQEHCVINNSSDERIILTLSIRGFSYADVLPYLMNLAIDSY
jgi:hypothetical protein